MEIEILYIIIGRVAKYRFDSLLLPMQCNNLLPYNIYRYNISNRVFPSQQSPFEQNSIKKATTRSQSDKRRSAKNFHRYRLVEAELSAQCRGRLRTSKIRFIGSMSGITIGHLEFRGRWRPRLRARTEPGRSWTATRRFRFDVREVFRGRSRQPQ